MKWNEISANMNEKKYSQLDKKKSLKNTYLALHNGYTPLSSETWEECLLSPLLFNITVTCLADKIIKINKKYIDWKGRNKNSFIGIWHVYV